MSTLPPLINGRYLPEGVLGRGGMGIVYVVEHVHTGERLALKVLTRQASADPAALTRFKREARASAQIKSEHVVRVIDADYSEDLNAFFLVMELLEGSSLEQLASAGPIAPDVVVGWLRQVARGLEKAHRSGVVHRDLKPENLFRTRRDDGSELVKILDFGIAKLTLEGDSATNATATGNLVGTPRYMAPEQAGGEPQAIGVATDVWALGMIAFRLLTGREYWSGSSVSQILGQVLYAPIRPPSEVGAAFGEAFDAWFVKSCAREPARRWASAEEQVEALAAAITGVEPDLRPSLLDQLGSAPTLAVTPVGLGSRPALGSGDAPTPSPGGSLAASANATGSATPSRGPSARMALFVLLGAGVVGLGLWLVPKARDGAPATTVESARPTAVQPAPSALTPDAASPVGTEDAGPDAAARGDAKSSRPVAPRGTGKKGRNDPLAEQY